MLFWLSPMLAESQEMHVKFKEIFGVIKEEKNFYVERGTCATKITNVLLVWEKRGDILKKF